MGGQAHTGAGMLHSTESSQEHILCPSAYNTSLCTSHPHKAWIYAINRFHLWANIGQSWLYLLGLCCPTFIHVDPLYFLCSIGSSGSTTGVKSWPRWIKMMNKDDAVWRSVGGEECRAVIALSGIYTLWKAWAVFVVSAWWPLVVPITVHFPLVSFF